MKSSCFAKLMFCAGILLPATPFAQTSRQDSLWNVCRNRQCPVENRRFAIVDVKTPRMQIGKMLYRVKRHPALDSLLTAEKEQELLALIEDRCNKLGKDSLLTSELFYVMRPYFDWCHEEDPHYRIFMPIMADDRVYKEKQIHRLARQLTTPAFSLLQINDTLVVDRSLDSQFHKGDMLLSINDVSPSEYLKYGYKDRYTYPISLMSRYFYSQVTDRFVIRFMRGSRLMEVTTNGAPAMKVLFELEKAEELDKNIRTYPEAKSGYIAVPEFFPNNNRLIRIIHNAIADFKKQGFTNVILDLRRNPGGNGHNFDELLSIFIAKPEIDYCKGQRIRVSKSAMQYYNFLKEEMLGKLIPMPEGEFVQSFRTNPKMFIEGINYYVLTSRDTGSVAASFVNMLQYNNAAKLVGEPLLHNALKYGEELDGGSLLPSLLAETSVSMIEIDECTRAADGVVTPDIPIPYTASNYLTGKDAMLEKLLEIIRVQTNG